jgi:hypothetical protein
MNGQVLNQTNPFRDLNLIIFGELAAVVTHAWRRIKDRLNGLLQRKTELNEPVVHFMSFVIARCKIDENLIKLKTM